MTHKFRTNPPNDKGYPGFTCIPLEDGREICICGVGEAVEAKLIEAKEHENAE